MAASIRKTFLHQQFGIFRDLKTFSYLKHQRLCLKRIVSTLPPVVLERDGEGNLLGPRPIPFPKGLDIDPAVGKKCEEEPFKYARRHPGRMSTKAPQLPVHLENNARGLLAGQGHLNNAQFIQDVTHLKEVFRRRHPPMERADRRLKYRTLTADKFNEHLAEMEADFEELSQDQKEKLVATVTGEAQNVYAKTTHNWKPLSFVDYIGTVYMAARLSPNYAVMLTVLKEIHRRDEQFVPTSVYNLGSGTGSVISAAQHIWKRNIFEYYCVDPSNYMNDMARSLLATDPDDPLSSSIPGVYFRQFAPSDKKRDNRFRLVVCAYLLMELPSRRERLDRITSLWRQTKDYLVLVEHGTKAGYRLIEDARSHILEMAATEEKHLRGHVFAPCSHDVACPKSELLNSPCTFSVQYHPLNLKNDYKQGIRKETERFTYLVMKKGQKTSDDCSSYPRVTEISHKHKHSHCTLCCQDGQLRTVIISKSKPSVHLYHCIRKGEAGDLLPVIWPDNEEPTSEA